MLALALCDVLRYSNRVRVGAVSAGNWAAPLLAVIVTIIVLGVAFVVVIAVRQRLERRKQLQLAYRSKLAQVSKRRADSTAKE